MEAIEGNLDLDKRSSEASLTPNAMEDGPPNGLRRILCMAILISGMIFNGIGESYESFVRKRTLQKYQSQSEVTKVSQF